MLRSGGGRAETNRAEVQLQRSVPYVLMNSNALAHFPSLRDSGGLQSRVAKSRARLKRLKTHIYTGRQLGLFPISYQDSYQDWGLLSPGV